MLCSTTHVYHYLRPGAEDTITAILGAGLRALSDMPDHSLFAHERARFAQRYDDLAAPLLRRPYGNSGVFFTTLDLRRLDGRLQFGNWRLIVPIARLDRAFSVLTYMYAGKRQRFPLDAESLGLAARRWDRERIERWLGAEPTRWFFHVPQVVTFQPGGVLVLPGDVDPPATARSTERSNQ